MFVPTPNLDELKECVFDLSVTHRLYVVIMEHLPLISLDSRTLQEQLSPGFLAGFLY